MNNLGLMDIAFTYPCFYRYQCSDYQNIYVWWKYLNIANEKNGFGLCSIFDSRKTPVLLCSLTYVWNYDFREWKASVGWFKPVRKFRLSKTKDMYQPAEGKPKVKVWGGNTVHTCMNRKVLMWASKWIKMVIWKKKWPLLDGVRSKCLLHVPSSLHLTW